MSFFYLNPVKGDLPVHLLETIVTERLEYLKTVFSGKPPVYNEYLVEGSTYDNVGHFILCVLTILSENKNFKQYFLRSEIELFKRRLNPLGAYDLRCFAKKILRTIRKYEELPSFIHPLLVLCQHLTIKSISQHITLNHDSECTAHTIPLHFKHCLAFIAKRQIELKNGTAYLPCGKWKQYLIQLYSTNLRCRLNLTDLEALKSDFRIMDLLAKLKKDFSFFNNNKTPINTLLSKDIENASRFFPPCMLNLHTTLRKKHRLTHNQRFYYSLFLKDIGLPVHEAVDFWRQEYRQNPNGGHSCCHNWERDEKKYLYGIRHMYGLEGARKTYTTANCSKIQNSDISCSEGGCPFKFDQTKMIQILSSKVECSEQVLKQISDLKLRNQFTSACIISLQRYVSPSDIDSFNFTPVKFYNAAMKCNHVDEIKI